LHSKIYKGVIRLLLNPSKVLLFSNRAEDNNPLDERMAAGMSTAQAIDDLLAARGITEPA
jgi:conjugal transfer ATP-binding protein TraC